MKDSKKGKKIIVNALSISRIIGAILIPILISTANMKSLVAVIIVFFITDTLDGLLARAWSVQTKGGALLDPLGDKLLVLSCILSLVGNNKILLISLLLELIIVILNVWRTLHGENAIASICGKIKMWPLSITLVLAAINRINPKLLKNIFNITITKDVVMFFAIITILAEIITIINYIVFSIKNKNIYTKKIIKLNSIKDVMQRLFDTEAYKEDKNKPLIEIIRK